MKTNFRKFSTRRTVCGTLIWVLWASCCFAQDHSLALANGKFLKIQACGDDIFRVRIASIDEFPETLMERYGIVKKDWNYRKSLVERGRIYELTTAHYRLEINSDDGRISVKSLKGDIIISNISALSRESSTYGRLKRSIEAEERELTGKEIIGDTSQRQVKVLDTAGPPEAMQVEPSALAISLTPDERFYGGGAASRKSIQHRGSLLRMWATYQKSDMVAPFLMSSQGWGIFNNTTALNYFDVGRMENDRLYVYNTDGTLDFYVMLGQTMDQIIDLYTSITGRPYLLPKWGYGLAFGGNMMEDQFRMMDHAVRFRDEGIPLDVYWIEPQWMAKFYDYSTEKDWDLKKFPAYFFWQTGRGNRYENRQLFLSKLRQLGYHVALWLCIDHDLSLEEEDHLAVERGEKPSGETHWFPHLMKFVDQGVDGFKLDPGRTLDEHPDRKYYNGSTDKLMHNLNQVLLPKQMYRVFREHKNVRSFHHYCGGYAGTQHWGASTAGDNGGGRDALYDQLNLGLSGFLNTSADVMDGVEDVKAGLHFGFFLPWVQVNSWASMHYPWYFSSENKQAFRFYAQLRNSLMPYIYSAALQGSQTGMPMLRAMPLVFPDDRKVDNMTSQFMFGENLLLSVFTDSIYLPTGKWVNYWTGEKVAGGQTVSGPVPQEAGGQLFVKSGAIIPFQKIMKHVGERPLDTLVLKVYPEGTSSYTLCEDDGMSFEFEKGRMTKTRFECRQAGKEIELAILPTEGFYQGMVDSRTYEVAVYTEQTPAQLWINDLPAENWKTGDGVLHVSVPRADVRRKQLVRIIMQN